MDFMIVDVFTQDGQLVVKAEHYHPTGALWFVEHYTWQGREGLKQKRATNALGQPLLDDGTVAPSTTNPGPPVQVIYWLPDGRSWLRLPAPHMVNHSILTTIRSIHRQRLTSGWPQGKIDRLPAFKFSPEDEAGCPVLLTKFRLLVGQQE